MAEIRVKETGTIKLFESDNTSSVTIASPASLGADRTVTLPDASVTLVSGTMNDATALSGNIPVSNLNSGTSASSSTFWRGDGTWVAAGGDNTPAFQAKLSANQNPTDLTWTVVGCNTEIFDSDGCYDTTTYRFTPTTAGKYYIYWSLTADISVVGTLTTLNTAIGKNSTRQDYTYLANSDSSWTNMTYAGSTVIDMDGSSDYIDLWGYIDVSSGASYFYGGSYFGAYLLIGA